MRDAEDAGVLLALRGERMTVLDSIQAVADGKTKVDYLLGATNSGRGGGIPAQLSLKPMLSEDARFAVRYMTRIIDAIIPSLPADLPAYRAKGSTLPRLNGPSMQHSLSSMLLPGTDRLFEQHYRGLTDNRLAAIALAVRWRRADHDGEFPKQLSYLVPHYLPAVPADPMAAGRPLGYARAGTTDPVIYSVGINGTDEGGNESPLKPAHAGDSPWDSLDVVVHLTPQPRKPDLDADDTPKEAPATSPAR